MANLQSLYQMLLGSLEQQHNVRFRPQDVVFTRKGPDLDGVNVRELNVAIQGELTATVNDFTLMVEPVELSRLLHSGAAIMSFPEDGGDMPSFEQISEAMAESLNTTLYDDSLQLTTSSDSHGKRLTIAATEDSLIYRGQLSLFRPRDLLELLVDSNGGQQLLSNATQVAAQRYASKLSTIDGVLPGPDPSLVSQALFQHRRILGASPVHITTEVGGPDQPVYQDFPIEVEGDLTEYHYCGATRVAYPSSEGGPTIRLELHNRDSNDDLLLSWSYDLNKDENWVAIPITAPSSVLRVVSTDPQVANGLVTVIHPYRMRFLRQDIDEYCPTIVENNGAFGGLRFESQQRLETEPVVFVENQQMLGITVDVATLADSGISNLVSIQNSEGVWMQIQYDAAANEFVGISGGTSVRLEVTSETRARVLFWASTQQVRLYHDGAIESAPVSQPTPLNSGRIRVGGGAVTRFTATEVFHYRGNVQSSLALRLSVIN